MNADVTDMRRATVEEETELARRAGDGDHAAFTVLFERYKSSVYRFCRYMLDDDATADDVYQDVFLAFYRACRGGATMTSVKGYLLTSARTRCLSALQKSQRFRTIDDSFERSERMDELAGETGEILQAALLRLPHPYREALLLFEVEGYSYAEICELLNVTHDVVKNRIYRAKQSLQKILRPILGDDNQLNR